CRCAVPMAVALLAALPAAQAYAIGTKAVDNAMLGNEADGTDWPAYGRTFSESRFSPLQQVNDSNVSRLGLAWWLDLDVPNSITAPVEAGGIIYLAAGYSIVHAIRATDGHLLWGYEPQVPEAAGQKLRAGWGIRGLALWQDKVYVGTQDGRLLALAAAAGRPGWSVHTLHPANGAYISGAPRAFNGKVVIGNAGADFSPVRGYVTAYDAETGREIWRFYVVPGKPGSKDGAASDEVMDKAAATWTGEWWKFGGGGNVWNSMTFDPKFNRLYLGTGNAGPANWKLRNPEGRDTLHTAALAPAAADPGHYVWHYQTTPGDAWDYDS